MSDRPADAERQRPHDAVPPVRHGRPGQPEMSWLPLSYDAATGQGTYLMRMEPGAVRSRTTTRAWRSS